MKTQLSAATPLATRRRGKTQVAVRDFVASLEQFQFREGVSLFDEGKATRIEQFAAEGHMVKRFVNEYWTSGQRKANSMHEVSYRACFKPQLPRFFIERLTRIDDLVYDPFAGRGTTAVEAALLRRRVASNDINPVSQILTEPRLNPPDLAELEEALGRIHPDRSALGEVDIDLSMFYHPDTLLEIATLRRYLRYHRGPLSNWIRMVATNRLTGHSSGFFSVYTMPPNQAISAAAQAKLNIKRSQSPPYRDTRAIILRKSASLLADITTAHRAALGNAAQTALFTQCDARAVRDIRAESVQLTVTSPPFLDVVQYDQDNWLRCWFNSIDASQVAARITMLKRLEDWAGVMGDVFRDLYRMTRRGGWVAFEVGDVRGGRIMLDEKVAPLGIAAGFECVGVMVNEQRFTKTANCWGVRNNTKGTNTNRIVVFYKGGRAR